MRAKVKRYAGEVFWRNGPLRIENKLKTENREGIQTSFLLGSSQGSLRDFGIMSDIRESAITPARKFALVPFCVIVAHLDLSFMWSAYAFGGPGLAVLGILNIACALIFAQAVN